jgi:2-polyprenyl-3-methyl-5-hydroxy-6-metoxy-1,4-benzoquinol methylase
MELTSSYVREYFDLHAEDWLAEAYTTDRLSADFPLGEVRTRAALSGVAPAVPADGSLVDLGCGGGQLCIHAARLGLHAVGIDVAPAMIEAAQALRSRLPEAEAGLAEFRLGRFEDASLTPGAWDAVTAMGVIEYLPEDDRLFEAATRLLRPTGRFAVSCRNRLFNLQSANRYTTAEVEDGGAPALAAELAEQLGRTSAEEVRAVGEALANASDAILAATTADADHPPAAAFDHATEFAAPRRQHTPRQIEAAGAAAGMRLTDVLCLHPHPLPPTLERLAPRTYNQVALALQPALERSPLGFAYCSSYVAVFERS